MGDLAVVSEYESALDPSKKSKRMCAMELSKALTLMGFGTWNNLEPEISRFQDGYVKTRLNERLFEKVQALEEKRAQLFRDQRRLAKLKKGGPQKRKQAELEELQMRKQEGKNKKSLDEEQRAIHESYQILLNEYYSRKSYRERGSKPLKSNDENESLPTVEAPTLIISNDETSTHITN